MSMWAVGPVGLIFLVFFGVAIPIVAYRARDRLTTMRPRPSRAQLYGSTLVQLGVFLLLGLDRKSVV